MAKVLRPCPVCGAQMPAYAAVNMEDKGVVMVRICPMGEVVAADLPNPRPGFFRMGLPQGSLHREPGQLWTEEELDEVEALMQLAVA
jgi:hypothetical protein